jgi:hypothetical protein
MYWLILKKKPFFILTLILGAIFGIEELIKKDAWDTTKIGEFVCEQIRFEKEDDYHLKLVLTHEGKEYDVTDVNTILFYAKSPQSLICELYNNGKVAVKLPQKSEEEKK